LSIARRESFPFRMTWFPDPVGSLSAYYIPRSRLPTTIAQLPAA